MRWQVCKIIIETDTFQLLVYKNVYKINHRFTCSNKCLVYLLLCKVCGMQINCKTNDEFWYRCNNYKDKYPKSLKGE